MIAILLNEPERCAGNKKSHPIPLCFPHWLWIMHDSVRGREKLYQPNVRLLSLLKEHIYLCVLGGWIGMYRNLKLGHGV